MYPLANCNFNNGSVTSTVVRPTRESTLGQPNRDWSYRSSGGAINLIGQCFSNAFADELHLRGLVAGRTVMRTLGAAEILEDERYRIRVELDIITAIPGTTHNDLIDIIVSAKRKCSFKIGPDVKIFIKAELRSPVSRFALLPYWRMNY